jgi:hypothetical protein
VQKSTLPRKKAVLVNPMTPLHRIPIWCTPLLPFSLAYAYFSLFALNYSCIMNFVSMWYAIILCAPSCKMWTWQCGTMPWCFWRPFSKKAWNHMYKRKPKDQAECSSSSKKNL